MKRSWFPGAAAFVAAMVVAACAATSDLGRPCQLVKKVGDSGVGPIVPSDIQSGGTQPDQDIISKGAQDCLDEICMLDAQSVPAALAAAIDAGTGVIGYCTSDCNAGHSSDCSDLAAGVPNTPANRMTCQSKILSTGAIGTICANTADPTCQLLGDDRSSYLCSRGPDVTTILDGG